MPGPGREVGAKSPRGELGEHLEVLGRGRVLHKALGHPPIEAGQTFVSCGEQADGHKEPSEVVSRCPVGEPVEGFVSERHGGAGEAPKELPNVNAVEPDDDPVGPGSLEQASTQRA